MSKQFCGFINTIKNVFRFYLLSVGKDKTVNSEGVSFALASFSSITIT